MAEITRLHWFISYRTWMITSRYPLRCPRIHTLWRPLALLCHLALLIALRQAVYWWPSDTEPGNNAFVVQLNQSENLYEDPERGYVSATTTIPIGSCVQENKTRATGGQWRLIFCCCIVTSVTQHNICDGHIDGDLLRLYLTGSCLDMRRPNL